MTPGKGGRVVESVSKEASKARAQKAADTIKDEFLLNPTAEAGVL